MAGKLIRKEKNRNVQTNVSHSYITIVNHPISTLSLLGVWVAQTFAHIMHVSIAWDSSPAPRIQWCRGFSW